MKKDAIAKQTDRCVMFCVYTFGKLAMVEITPRFKMRESSKRLRDLRLYTPLGPTTEIMAMNRHTEAVTGMLNVCIL